MMEIDSELVRLLMRVGYSAGWNGHFAQALTIFRGVSAVRPESEVPLIGAAVVGMLAKDYDLATKILDRAVENHPENDLVKAHQGCLLRLKGQEEEGQAILSSIAENSEDPNAKVLATQVKDTPVEELFAAK